MTNLGNENDLLWTPVLLLHVAYSSRAGRLAELFSSHHHTYAAHSEPYSPGFLPWGWGSSFHRLCNASLELLGEQHVHD